MSAVLLYATPTNVISQNLKILFAISIFPVSGIETNRDFTDNKPANSVGVCSRFFMSFSVLANCVKNALCISKNGLCTNKKNDKLSNYFC